MLRKKEMKSLNGLERRNDETAFLSAAFQARLGSVIGKMARREYRRLLVHQD